MKLTKKEIARIAKLYNLGEVKKSWPIKGGAVNYNFEVVTEKGNFIIRIIGIKFSKWKQDKMKLEFRVLDYLNKNNFQYEIPCPIKMLNGKIMTRISGHNLWVYRKLEGEAARRVSFAQMKEIARAIAIYHKFISKMKINRKRLNDSWIISKLSKMKEIVPKEKIDYLMLKNIHSFEKHFNDFRAEDFKENELIAHSDFNKENILFKGNKVAAFIDFDNLELAPRVKDIAYGIRCFCFVKGKLIKAREKAFLKEYEKVSKISKTEKEAILPFINRDNSIRFWWFYSEMKKMPEKRYPFLKKVIKINRDLVGKR